MWTTATIDDLRRRRAAMEKVGGPVALVPTMGALHDGHVSLIRAAREQAKHVIVSIFVNPTQFGPSEDFTRYPRPIHDDLSRCEQAGADGVFQPDPAEMYPPDAPPSDLDLPTRTGELEGAARPGHFRGVCRVVLKLFNIVQPHLALFGMKDYQQLRVVDAMVRDLNVPVRVVPCPTLREPDGLAMSSRNIYLSAEQRRRAVGLHKALQQARQLIEQGETDPAAVEHAMRQVITAHQFDSIDYAVVRHPQTLGRLDCLEPAVTGGVVALAAARLGATRLLDNLVVGG